MIMFIEFFTWWYGKGWANALQTAKNWLAGVQREFSADILVKTLFDPWKRIVSGSGLTLDKKLSTMLDNFVSRCVGFIIRSITLLASLFAMFFAAIAGFVWVIVWPLLLPGIVYCLFRGIAG
jgi:hypothetical protein